MFKRKKHKNLERGSTEHQHSVRERVRLRPAMTAAPPVGAPASATSPDHPNETDDYGPLMKALGAVKRVVGCMAVPRDQVLRAATKTRSSTACSGAKPLRNAGWCGTCYINRVCYWNEWRAKAPDRELWLGASLAGAATARRRLLSAASAGAGHCDIRAGHQNLLSCGSSGADVPPYEGYAGPYHLFSVTFALAVLPRPVFSAAADAPAGCLECAAAALVRRTPGSSPSVNWTPAASNARCSESTVRSFSSAPRSNLATVSTDTLAAAARSRTPHPKAARAIRHCKGHKIITLFRFQLQYTILTTIVTVG